MWWRMVLIASDGSQNVTEQQDREGREGASSYDVRSR